MRESLEYEMKQLITKLLGFIEQIFPTSETIEEKVYWLKYQGDYYRDLAAIERDINRQIAYDKSLESYMLGLTIGDPLPPTDILILALALHFAVFCYEVEGDRDRAIKIAQKYFDRCGPWMQYMTDDCYKDTVMYLGMLRDNITVFSSSCDSEEQVDDEIV